MPDTPSHPPAATTPAQQSFANTLHGPATSTTSTKSDLSKSDSDHAQGRVSQSTTSASGTSQLASQRMRLRAALRHFPDFPIKGIDFVDIMPLFADPSLHECLIDALALQVQTAFSSKPDVVIALDARGFLFGPSLALRLGAGFAPVRKAGKLPGPTETVSYKKEYGEDLFQVQKDAVAAGQTVLVVDDIIATGGSAQAAGALVEKLGGKLMGFIFILELDFLKGRELLTAPVHTLLSDFDA